MRNTKKTCKGRDPRSIAAHVVKLLHTAKSGRAVWMIQYGGKMISIKYLQRPLALQSMSMSQILVQFPV